MTRYGYMDYVDYSCELGEAPGGNIIYPSIKDVKKRKACVEECGIVKVSVEQVEIVKDQNFSSEEESEEQQRELRIKHLKGMIQAIKNDQAWYENRLKELEAGKDVPITPP